MAWSACDRDDHKNHGTQYEGLSELNHDLLDVLGHCFNTYLELLTNVKSTTRGQKVEQRGIGHNASKRRAG